MTEFVISGEELMWNQTLGFKQCVGLASDISREQKKPIISAIDTGIRMLEDNDYIAWQNIMNMAARRWQNL